MTEIKSLAIHLVKDPNSQPPTGDDIFASEQAIEGKTRHEANDFLYERLEKDVEADRLDFDDEWSVYVNTDNVALIRAIVTYIVSHIQNCQLMIYSQQSKQYEPKQYGPIPFRFDDVTYADWEI